LQDGDWFFEQSQNKPILRVYFCSRRGSPFAKVHRHKKLSSCFLIEVEVNFNIGCRWPFRGHCATQHYFAPVAACVVFSQPVAMIVMATVPSPLAVTAGGSPPPPPRGSLPSQFDSNPCASGTNSPGGSRPSARSIASRVSGYIDRHRLQRRQGQIKRGRPAVRESIRVPTAPPMTSLGPYRTRPRIAVGAARGGAAQARESRVRPTRILDRHLRHLQRRAWTDQRRRYAAEIGAGHRQAHPRTSPSAFRRLPAESPRASTLRQSRPGDPTCSPSSSRRPILCLLPADDASFLAAIASFARQGRTRQLRTHPLRVAYQRTGFPRIRPVNFCHNPVDADRTINVRATVPNPDGVFVPGLCARSSSNGAPNTWRC